MRRIQEVPYDPADELIMIRQVTPETLADLIRWSGGSFWSAAIDEDGSRRLLGIELPGGTQCRCVPFGHYTFKRMDGSFGHLSPMAYEHLQHDVHRRREPE